MIGSVASRLLSATCVSLAVLASPATAERWRADGYFCSSGNVEGWMVILTRLKSPTPTGSRWACTMTRAVGNDGLAFVTDGRTVQITLMQPDGVPMPRAMNPDDLTLSIAGVPVPLTMIAAERNADQDWGDGVTLRSAVVAEVTDPDQVQLLLQALSIPRGQYLRHLEPRQRRATFTVRSGPVQYETEMTSLPATFAYSCLTLGVEPLSREE